MEEPYGLNYVYDESEDYTIRLQEVVDEPTQENVIMVHFDAVKINRKIIRELSDKLKILMNERKSDISYCSSVPAIIKLARLIRMPDMTGTFEHDEITYKFGTWEYN
jgi:hypothetical protein